MTCYTCNTCPKMWIERTAVSTDRVVDGAWKTSGFGAKRGEVETAEE